MKGIKYLDISAPKFNLYINGKSCYRTVWGGVFHLIIMLTIFCLFLFSFLDSVKRVNPTVLINSGFFSYMNFDEFEQPNNQQIIVEVDKTLAQYHSFVVSGMFKNSTIRQKLLNKCEENNLTVSYCIKLSEINFINSSAVFISFPKCNHFPLKNDECNPSYTDEQYESFLNTVQNPFPFRLLLTTVGINIGNYYNKYIISNETDLLYLSKKRGAYYIINMKRMMIQENKEWVLRGEGNKTLSYFIESKNQETTDNLASSEISYSVMLKLDQKMSTIYYIKYDTIFDCFSFIGGLTSCISFFSFIKTILSTHFADIFMLNYNFVNTHSNRRKPGRLYSDLLSGNELHDLGVNDDLSDRQSFSDKKKDFELDERLINPSNQRYTQSNINKKENYNESINKSVNLSDEDKIKNALNQTNLSHPNNEKTEILTYRTYLRYKIFKCCLKKGEKIYINYKWILDVNYLLKIYIQFHYLKSVVLSKNQIQLLENIAMYEKINVNSNLNIKRMYGVNDIGEQERIEKIENEITKFKKKEKPYDTFEKKKYQLTDEEIISKKLISTVSV